LTGSEGIVIAGVGHSAYSRSSPRSVPGLAIDAVRAALADAGLGAADIDAIVPVGGYIFADDLISNLGVRTDVIDVLPAPGGNGGVSSLGIAEMMILSGRARTALVIMSRKASVNRIVSRVPSLPGPQFRTFLEQPHGWAAPVQWYSMIARRHMIEYGTSKAAMAEVALTMRAHAQLNPNAVMRGKPLTQAEYDAGPMISDPYQLHDCCLETDGAVALVLRLSPRGDRDGRTKVALEAVASSRPSSPEDLTNRVDWFDIGLRSAARACYERAGIGPADVDVAMIYDCFTFEVLHQLEEAGFCERGESDKLVRSGGIALGGPLPVNTHGGLLSEGHLMGLSHVVEAVRQLRHEASGRQVRGARIAVVTGWGDWGDGSMALLRGRLGCIPIGTTSRHWRPNCYRSSGRPARETSGCRVACGATASSGHRGRYAGTAASTRWAGPASRAGAACTRGLRRTGRSRRISPGIRRTPSPSSR
jgi:acetyl-CoA acetyltransferase